jgi:hypothetical protein
MRKVWSEMPVTYQFDSNIVVIDMVGEYSMDEIRTTILNSLADSTCPANPFVLMNLCEARSIYNRSPQDVITMARSLASLSNRFNNRIALVASKDLPYGLMRMGSIFSEETGFAPKVFRTFAEARKWLLS